MATKQPLGIRESLIKDYYQGQNIVPQKGCSQTYQLSESPNEYEMYGKDFDQEVDEQNFISLTQQKTQAVPQ